MASTHFANLTTSVQELKRVYLDAALAAAVPTPDHQEMARAFVSMVHAELEYYVEEACRALAQEAFRAAVAGNYAKASIALINFSGLDPMRGGATLTGAGKTPARRLSTRFGAAHAAFIKTIDANNGVREKHLAALTIPLGLDPGTIDSTWLAELDAFCSWRGAYGHMSRTSQRGSHLAVNPADVWQKCERVIWTDPALGAPGVINSFESLDAWFEAEKVAFGPYVTVPEWRLRLARFVINIVAKLRKREEAGGDDAD